MHLPVLEQGGAMRAYGLDKRDGRTCKYGCCHGDKAPSKGINVRCSTSGARNKGFKPAVSAYGRGRARNEARSEARDSE